MELHELGRGGARQDRVRRPGPEAQAEVRQARAAGEQGHRITGDGRGPHGEPHFLVFGPKDVYLLEHRQLGEREHDLCSVAPRREGTLVAVPLSEAHVLPMSETQSAELRARSRDSSQNGRMRRRKAAHRPIRPKIGGHLIELQDAHGRPVVLEERQQRVELVRVERACVCVRDEHKWALRRGASSSAARCGEGLHVAWVHRPLHEGFHELQHGLRARRCEDGK